VEAVRLRGGTRRGPAATGDPYITRSTESTGSNGTVAVSRHRARREKLSKDAYRRQKAAAESDLTRLNLRKNHLELAMSDPAIAGNFVEMRRVTGELADVEVALAAAEDAWLDVEERAP
jgi:hypothetical protein